MFRAYAWFNLMVIQAHGLRIPFELNKRMWNEESPFYESGSKPQVGFGFSSFRPVISRGFYLLIRIESRYKVGLTALSLARQIGASNVGLRKEATQPTLLTAFKQIVGKKTAHTVYRLIHRRPIIGNLNVGQRKAVARQGLHTCITRKRVAWMELAEPGIS